MMKLLGFLVLILASSCGPAPEAVPSWSGVYDGKPLNLMAHPQFTMFRDSLKDQVDENLNGEAVSLIAAAEPGIWWLETTIDIPKHIRDQEDIWLFVHSNVNVLEMYFNRHLLIKNGQMASAAAEEESGRVIAFRQIPRVHIKTGDAGRATNTLRIQFSNRRYEAGHQFFDLSVGPPGMVERKIGPHVYGPLFLAGIFLLAVCINLAFFIALDKKPVFLLLSGLFLACFGSMAQDMFLFQYRPSVAYLHSAPFELLIPLTIFGLLAWVIWAEFSVEMPPKKRLQLGVLAFVGLAFGTLFAEHQLFPFFLSLVPLVQVLFARFEKRPHSFPLLLALLLISGLVFWRQVSQVTMDMNIGAASLLTYLDFLGLALFAIVMILLSTRGMLRKNQLLHLARMRSASLENELLQKHLQPHFLMNSLMSLQQLIATDQGKASTMVEALSEEFHLLNSARKQKLISLSQELDICRAHLQIMSLQQQAAFSLEIEGITGDEVVPPAVFHTLIENGLTHGYAGKQSGTFHLSKAKQGEMVRYRLVNDGSSKSAPNKKNGGMGLSYVRARLEESFPGRWHLTSRACDPGWETLVEWQESP